MNLDRRRRQKLRIRTPRQKVVSDSYDQFSQHSEPSDHDFQYHQPELIQNDMSSDNSHLGYRSLNLDCYPNPHYY